MQHLLIRNWWTFVLRGVVAILFGIFALTFPGITLETLVFLFSALAISWGIIALFGAVFRQGDLERQGRPWWSLVAEGLVSILGGVLTIAWPGLTAFIFLNLVAAWAIITGSFEIAAAIRLRQEIKGEWLLALAGLCTALFGIFLVLLPPQVGLFTLIAVMAAYALIDGTALVSVGFWLKRRVTMQPVLTR